MNIILIDPAGNQPGVNAGLAYLASALKKNNIYVKVLDLNNYKISFQDLKEEIRKFKPDIIGYSVKTATYYSAVKLSKMLKTEFPKVSAIAGGPHITLTHTDFIRENPHINFLITGEGEEVFPNLCKSIDSNISINNIKGIIYSNSGNIISNPPEYVKDLNKLPFPDFKCFNYYNFKKYNYPLITSRGCPYQCIYCSVPSISGKKWRYRTPENIIEELIYAKKNYDIEEFEILDDIFTLNPGRVIAFCNLLIKKNINLRWACPNGIRADNISEELARMMHKSGCHTVTIGIESSDPQVFNFINKNESLSQIEKAVKIFKKTSIRVGGYFIIGLPYDNYQKTKNSLKYAGQIGIDWAHFNLLSLYPGTKVYNWMKRNGTIFDDYRKSIHFGGKIKPIFETKSFKAKRMVDAYKMVHTKQLLFHLIDQNNLTPWRKNIFRLILLLKYNKSFLFKQIKIILTKFPKIVLRILFYEIKKMASRFAYIFAVSNRNKFAGKTKSHSKKEHLKILHLNNIYDYSGGTEIYMINVCKNLQELGHEVAIIYDKGNPKNFLDKNWRAYHIPFVSEYHPENDKTVQKKLKEIINKENPDIIHLHNIYNPQTVLNSMKMRPTMRTMHDYYSLCPAHNKYLRGSSKICKKSFGLYCLWRLPWDHCAGSDMQTTARGFLETISEINVNKNLDKILVTSNYMKKELIKNAFSPTTVNTQPLFSEISIDKKKRASYLDKIILAIGRISIPDKGFDYLIKALSYLKSDFEAVIIGDGPDLNYIKQQAYDLGLNDKVKFTGWLSRKEIEDYYAKCRVVIVPSMWAEPFGLIGIEAMTYSKPVIAFNVGGIPDWLIHKKNGFLIKRGNAKKMASKIQLLLENPELAKKLGIEGKNIVEKKYNKKASMNSLIDIYRELV